MKTVYVFSIAQQGRVLRTKRVECIREELGQHLALLRREFPKYRGFVINVEALKVSTLPKPHQVHMRSRFPTTRANGSFRDPGQGRKVYEVRSND